jgi:hypothetical protein
VALSITSMDKNSGLNSGLSSAELLE